MSTLLIGLIPQHVRKMRPPRALLVPFELGRPLGSPQNVTFQQQVLDQAFKLLDHSVPGSYLAEFADDAPDAATSVEPGWSCPVSFDNNQQDDASSAITQEVTALKPWFDRALQRRGHTATGTSGLQMQDIIKLLTDVADGTTSSYPTELNVPFGDLFKLAAEDLKMFYAEAAMEQPNPGSSVQLQDWFWNDTQAGALLLSLADGSTQLDDKLVRTHARFTLVPNARLVTHKAAQTQS